jgi:PAS domain S-box-containing protein
MDPSLRFLGGGNGVATLMRARDWSDSPLGPPERWPQPLRSVVGLLLASKFPMFVAWGPELGFLYNDAYAEILGRKHPDALGRRFEDIWGEIWADIRPLVDRALAGESTYQEDLPLLMHRKGYPEQTWFTFSYSPVFDERGDVAGMFCACTETTAVVLASRHREREIERLRQMFQQAPGLVGILRGPEHVYEIANETYRQLVGGRDLIGKRVVDALPEVAGQGFVRLLDKVYQTGEAYVGHAIPVRLERTPGSGLEERFIDFVYQPLRDESGEVGGIFFEGSDVTEAVRTVQALRESEQRMRQLANTIQHLAWMADPDGKVQWYNDRWREYTGLTSEQLHTDALRDAIHPDDLDEVVRHWTDSIRSGEPYAAVMRLRRADGTWRRFSASAAPVRDADGRVVQWFGTTTDVEDAHLAREALLDASQRKDEFLAMLAHELRNPLAPISAAAQVLRLVAQDDPRTRRASEVITRQVGHMVELVDDLLDVSRVTRGLVELQRERLAVDAIVAHAVEQARPLLDARGHALAVELPHRAPHVVGDRTRLTQVVSNLLNNAAKFTPPGGRIALRVAVHEQAVALSVEDDGIGIDATLLPHVFELFTQAERTPDRAQGGLGIGLALARSLAELQGGTLTAHSAGLNTGATFTLTLPLAPELADAAPAPANGTVHAWKRNAQDCSVLVIDDNADAAAALADLLDALGHATTTHTDPASALRAAQRERYDALVVDIGMPGMDGYELARRLRAGGASSGALLIALTGYGQLHDRVQSRQAGFDAHLVKPVDTADLLRLLEGCMRRRAGAAGAATSAPARTASSRPQAAPAPQGGTDAGAAGRSASSSRTGAGRNRA